MTLFHVLGRGRNTTLLIIAAAMLATALSGCPLAPPKYSIIQLDSRVSHAEAVNEHGEVVGQVEIAPDERRPFLWRPAHTPKLTELPTLGGDSGLAGGINEYTEVAGYANNSDGWTHAFHWTEAGGIDDLGALGVGYSAALDVNNAGEVVGHTGYTDGTRRAFIWTDTGGMDVIPGAAADSFATAINEVSSVVGAVHDEANIGTADPPVAQIWYGDGTMAAIPSTLGGAGSIATGINVANTVVGMAANGSDEFYAFKWTSSGGMQNLGSLGSCYSGDYDFCSAAASINVHGDIVGSAAFGSDQSHAVLWKGNKRYDLNDLIPSGTDWEFLADAVDINDQGCIAGAGSVMVGSELRRTAYLLVPVVLKRLTTSPMMARGGSTLTGTVHLDGEAPFPLDMHVHLDGLEDAARLTGDTVTVPEGASSARFDIETFPVETRRTGSVVASFGGTTVSKTLTINPAHFFPRE